MSRIHVHSDDERNSLVPYHERTFSVSSQVNANNAKGFTDLDRFAFNGSQEKDPTTGSTSLTSIFNAPTNSSQFQFFPAPNLYDGSAATSRTGPRPIYLGTTARANHEFSFDDTVTGYGHRSPRELQYNPGLQGTLPGEFDLEDYEHAPPYGPHENVSAFEYFGRDWSPSSPVTTSPTGVYPRPTSSLKAAPMRTRTRTTPRHQHHQYLDSLLRSKCPKDRIHALNVAIQFRDEHNVDELIPNDLLDELLEPAGDDKYFCFCCPRARKARTITPARDHVRKSLGNFPFQCSNSWCRHSSLRQADLNKHMKTCINTAASQ